MLKQASLCAALVMSVSSADAASEGPNLDVSRYIRGDVVAAPADGGALPAPVAGGLFLRLPSPTEAIAGRFDFNQIIARIDTPVTGGGSDTLPCACVDALQVVLLVGPKYHGEEAYGGAFGVSTTGDAPDEASDLVGLSAGVRQDHNWPNARGYGVSSSVTLGPSGTAKQMIGHEVDVLLHNAQGTKYRAGFQAWAGGSHRASLIDAAYTVECSGGRSHEGACFANFFALQDVGGTLNKPLWPQGNIFVSESPTTIANVFKFDNVKVTGDILFFPSVVLTGAGHLTISTLRLDQPVDPASVPRGHLAFGNKLVADTALCGSPWRATGCWQVVRGDGAGGELHYIPVF